MIRKLLLALSLALASFGAQAACPAGGPTSCDPLGTAINSAPDIGTLTDSAKFALSVGAASTETTTGLEIFAYLQGKAYWLPLAGGTLTGELVTKASAAGSAGFNIPQGAAPTTPANGDVWTTSAGFFVRIAGSTLGPFNVGLLPANNLSDVVSAATSRTNLGLGTAATQSTGTSGAVLCLLNAADCVFSGSIEVGSATGGAPSAGSINISGSYLVNNVALANGVFTAGSNMTITGSWPNLTFASAGGSGVTWPTSGDFVVSNGTNSPAGLAPVNGSCAVGSGGVWTTGACGSGGSTAFSALTGSTNTTAAMVVGTGASLAASGSGTVAATSAPLSGITGLGTGVATALADAINTSGGVFTSMALSAGLSAATSQCNSTPYVGGNTLYSTSCPNIFTGTHDPITASESAGIDIANASGAMNFGLGQSGGAGFTLGTSYAFGNLTANVASVLNHSGNTGVLQGMPLVSSQVKLHQYGFSFAWPDATNWDLFGFPGYDTITAGSIVQFSSDGSGALTAAASTGTGSVVLATSPTLVTPALGTPSSVTLTNGTGLPTTGLTGSLSAAQIAGSAASHAVPVDVAGTPTWKVVPDCQDSGGNHLNYTQSSDAFSCGSTGGSGTGGGTFNYASNAVVGLAAAGTLYLPIGGGGIGSTTEANVSIAAPAATTVSNLQVNVATAPGTSNSYTVTLRDGATNESLTCTISGGSATNCSDTTHSFNVAKADPIDWSFVTVGTVALPATNYVNISAANGTSNVGVTSIATTSPITGGTITTTGTIACATCVTSASSLTSGALMLGSGSQGSQTDASITASAGALSLGSSGTAGSVAMGNASSGVITLQPVTGALGTVIQSLPARTATIVDGPSSSTNGDCASFNGTSGSLIQDAGAACGSGSAFAGPFFPTSLYPGTSGNLSVGLYTGSGGNASASEYGLQIIASLGSDSVAQLRFPMPISIPGSGTFKLRCDFLSAGTGTIKYTVSDADVAASASPSAATLTAETQNSVALGTADTYTRADTTLTHSTPSANDWNVVAVNFQTSGWTAANAVTAICREGWF